MKWPSLLREIHKTFGDLRFAVILILCFVIAMIYGTLMESYHGAEYAGRLVYKSTPFFLLQIAMFTSILVATFDRFPYKKHLAGFYVLHLGLLTLFVGAFITFFVGLDGTITLPPRSPVKEITLSDDILVMRFPTEGKEVTYALPAKARATDLSQSYEAIKLLRYLPYSEKELVWEKSTGPALYSSARYQIHNQMASSEITLSLHPSSEFESTAQMGPLNVHYMPQGLFPCFQKTGDFILWDAEKEQCFLPAEKSVRIKKSGQGQAYFTYPYQSAAGINETYTFYPELAPLPLDQKMQIIENASLRVFSKKLFEGKPHLFVFGKAAAFFDKNQKLWVAKELNLKESLELPWMQFNLTLLEHHTDAYPTYLPTPVTPIQENGSLIKGAGKAVLVELISNRGDKRQYWVTLERPLKVKVDDKPIEISLDKKKFPLPFELGLTRFKMDFDPGTKNPATYESFVHLFSGELSEDHHLYMNHPLKKGRFTFYQASYFQYDEQNYGSVLSVNYDPGRPFKYGGSILLILGSIWHFTFRHRRRSSSQTVSS